MDAAGLDATTHHKHYAQLLCSRAISPKTPAQSPVPPYHMKTINPSKTVQKFRLVLCCNRHPQTKVKTERGLIVGIVQPLSVARVPHCSPNQYVSPYKCYATESTNISLTRINNFLFSLRRIDDISQGPA